MYFRQWSKFVVARHQLIDSMSNCRHPTMSKVRCQGSLMHPYQDLHCGHRQIHYLGGVLCRNKLTVLKNSCQREYKQRQRLSTFLLTSGYSRTRRRAENKSFPEDCLPVSCTQKSNLFTHHSATKKEFAERRIMGYSRDQMFVVVSDIENYSKFLPWCESSVVTQRGLSYVQADLVIGMRPVTESYTSRVFLRKPSLIIAESNNGAHFKQMVTKWQFYPGLKTVPNSAIVDFYVSLEFKSALHANLANVFFSEVVKAMTSAFYEEARRRYGKESVPSRKIEVVRDENDKTQF